MFCHICGYINDFTIVFQSDYDSIAEINEKKKAHPHLYNLNMDPMMCGRIIHFIIEDDETIIGNGKAEGTDLALRGGR